MKPFIRALLMLTIATSLGCGKKDGESNGAPEGANIATLPPPSNKCLDTIHPNVWSPYQPYGFSGYSAYGYGYGSHVGPYVGPIHPHGGPAPYGPFGHPGPYGGPANTPYPAWYPQRGFCGCPAGTIPVCDDSAGMACVESRYMHNQPYTTWGWEPNAGRWNHAGWGQVQYQNSCYSGIGQACRVGSYTCGTQAICMATTVGSPMGVCVRH